MDDRTEGRDLQTMEKLSLGRWEALGTQNKATVLSVRCPSCDHANPAGSHYCNQCGMPVHFETCGRCEAINLRGAASCHKCGCVLPGCAIPESSAAAPVIVEIPPSQATDRLDSTSDLPPQYVAEPAPRRRHASLRAALIAFGLVLVAVPTYIATEHPASFHRVVDAIAQRGNTPGDSPAPAPGPPQPPPVRSPLEPADAQPVSPAATSEVAGAATQVASAPPSETARDYKASNSAAPAVARAVTKSGRPSTTKSNASRSKQGTSTRKAPARKQATKSP